MASAPYYRLQAKRCLLLSRATTDTNARLWLTDMAAYYVGKARAADEGDSAPASAAAVPALTSPRAA